MSISMAKRLDKVEDLPSLPHTLHKVLEGLDSVSASAKTLEGIIREDPVLTAKILKMANSPFYGIQGEVSSIAKAVVVLGFEEVRSLVIGLSLTGAFGGDLGVEEFDAQSLWLHSIGVAKTAHMLATHVNGCVPDELFTAGIVHDLGRFLLCLYFPKEYKVILGQKRQNGLPLFKVEESCGLSHAEAGAYLAKKWALSDMLVNVVRYHHHPGSAGTYSVPASIVFLADELCHKLKIGWDAKGEIGTVLVPKALGLAPEIIKKIARKIKKEKESIEASWSKVLSG